MITICGLFVRLVVSRFFVKVLSFEFKDENDDGIFPTTPALSHHVQELACRCTKPRCMIKLELWKRLMHKEGEGKE